MVVDDDELSLSVISLLLKSEGYEVVQAADGASAVEILGRLSPDELPSVLLADLRMPGLSGLDLAIALRQAAPRATLLAMSATPGAADGYDGFLKKPLDVMALRAALDVHRNENPAQAARTSEYLTLDEAVFEKLTHLMPASAVREVYEVCLEDARARGAEMRRAAEANDPVAVRRTAHTLKGGAGMVGAQKLAAAAARLELGVYRNEDVPQLVDNLLCCCDELQLILRNKFQL
jgi:CheY-like chemotaxis protein/HPt (histidine-containing phosphotransfer) domain-containing protein